jgi:O-antigen/teichoic acid export membrane protein
VDAEQFEAAQPPEPGPLGVTAARGVGLLVGRTLGLQLLTAGVTVALARLLTPADYGLFAIALAVQLVGQRAAELGLPAALVQMEETPSARLQSAVAGIVLLISTLLAAGVLVAAFVAAPAFGGSRTLEVVAIACCAIPFYATRAIPMVLMERELKFGRVAIVETADTLAFNGSALLAALAGLGAFSLAGAVAIGGIAGAITAWAIQPFTRRPTIDIEPVRPLAAFGLRVSVLQGVYLVKELGFISVLAAVGGAPVAGFYGMAKRLFSFPIALTSAVGRVSFPALSRDRDQRPARAARIVALTAMVAGLPLALVAGAIQPLISVLLGTEWLPTADIVLVGSVGMMLASSALSTMASYALAEGKPNAPIAAAIIEAGLLCVLGAVLIGPLAETGVGIAVAVSSVVATIAYAVSTHSQLRSSLVAVIKATLIAAIAAAAAQLLDLSNDVEGLLIAVCVVAAVWLALEMIFSRRELGEALNLVRPFFGKAKSA